MSERSRRLDTTSRLAAGGLCVVLVAAPCGGQSGAAGPPDAMAFIRVVADVRVEFLDGSRSTIERKGAELATGSGFVIAPGGLILTSLHVVSDQPAPRALAGQDAEVSIDARRIEVAIGRGGGQGVIEAYVVASDEENDLAALQVTAANLPYLPLGDSDALDAGRPVKVLGFPFGRQVEMGKRPSADVVPEVTVTAGSLSAVRANEQGDTRFLQTDASVHPGNSGGPMLDEEGYVVGVVRMKLAKDAASQGAGFAVPVNVVKDFLDASGLSAQLPVSRLRPGVVHTFDWKRLRVEMPDGFGDSSASRLLVDGGEAGDISFRVDRLASSLPVDAIQAAVMQGRELPGFVPATATVSRQIDAGGRNAPPRRLGTAFGTSAEGERFRVEFAIVDREKEKILARYVGPADAIAFNLALLRRSLQSLEADSMLLTLPLLPLERSAPAVVVEFVAFPQGDGGTVPVPAGWFVEPAARGSCASIPPAPSGLAASHPSDYTLVMRVLRWSGGGPALEQAVRACGEAAGRGAAVGSGPAGYARRFERFGLPIAARGLLVERGGESLLLELEAPVAKMRIVEGLYDRWVREVAAAR